MKKQTLKITRWTRAFILAGAITAASLFGHGKAVARTTIAFAPFALVAGMKKKGITLSDEEEKTMKAIEDEMNAHFTEMQKGLMSPADFKAKFDEAIKSLPTEISAKSIKVGEGEAAKSIEDILRAQGEDITKMQEQVKGAKPANPAQAQFDAIKALVAEVKKAKAQGGGQQFFISQDKTFDSNDKTDKAAATMTSGNVNANAAAVTVPANYLYGVEGQAEPDVRIDPYITQFLDNGSTDMAAIPYMDKTPTEGTMAITAEGALKPLLSWANERRFSTAFKIAGRTKVTEEALDDVPGLQAQANNELKYSHDIAEQDAVFTHVAAFAPSFVAGDLAATTDAPSRWDAVRAAIYAVKISSKGRFRPNVVVLNSADAYAMGATKDNTGQYIIPSWVAPDGKTISGVRVLETDDTDNVDAGEFIVGDWRKIKRRVYKPFNLRIGQGINGSSTAANITSDYETNQYTYIGESRLHLWHHKNHETAFIKSDFDTVMEAIDTTV